MKIKNHSAYRADDRNGKPFVIRREGDSVWVGVTEPVFETVHWSALGLKEAAWMGALMKSMAESELEKDDGDAE